MNHSTEKLARLKVIGFELAGSWHLIDGRLKCQLDLFTDDHNVLYAFAVEGELVYVGKATCLPLRGRLRAYETSARDRQSEHIRKELKSERRVEIYAFRPNGECHVHGVKLNLAAGMEDELIRELAPVWNVAGNSRRKRDCKVEAKLPAEEAGQEP